MKSQYEGTCTVCSKSFKVNDEIFLSKVNDSWVKCVDKECFMQQGGKIFEGGTKKPFVSQKIPIDDATKVFALAETLLESFKTKRKLWPRTTVESASNVGTIEFSPASETMIPLTTEEELQGVESFFKTLSGSYKP